MATASDTPTHVQSQPSRRIGGRQHRRQLLGALAAAPVATLPAVAMPAVDPHVEWLRYYLEMRDIASSEAQWQELETVRERLLTTPATTLEGSAARLALIADWSIGCSLDDEETCPPLIEYARLAGINPSVEWAAGETREFTTVDGGRG